MLVRFIDNGKIRVYIKDTLLKDYPRARLADEKRPLRVCGVEENAEVVNRYVQPHGRRLADGRIVCWGRAEDWKSILMALHERAFLIKNSKPHAAVLMYADGRFREAQFRAMVKAAAQKLCIAAVVWLD
jgi:hypothetical protein